MTSARNLKPRQVKNRIEELLAADWSDADLRDRMEALSEAQAFGGFTWLWGPELYRRNRILFRPFIVSHFSSYLIDDWNWRFIEWKGDKGQRLQRWYEDVDAQKDIELFKRLYAWKHQTKGRAGFARQQWQSDLVHRFQRASSAAERQTVLEMFDQRERLSQRAARELYRVDRAAASPFILSHLEEPWEEKRTLWSALQQEAREVGDDPFAFQLYRKQVPVKQWEQDVLQAADEIREPAALCDELERRHPEGYGLSLGMPIYRLIAKRGTDVFPYVLKHLRSVYRSWYGGRDGYTKLVRLAAKNQWWDLWSGLIRTSASPEEYNQELKRLLAGAENDAAGTELRLLQLTGISREWNVGPFGLAHVQQLEDQTAVMLYGRYPHLLRGPFKLHISAGWHGSFEKLVQQVMARDDEGLIDFLASRLVTRFASPHGWGQDQVDVARRLSEYYQKFRDDDVEFARRAVRVLGQVPAFSFWNYREVVRTNRLARMFYERAPEKYLAVPGGIRDLLEAAEIHAQALAFRVLGLDDERAGHLAAENLDLLQAALLRPLHRTTHLLAFRALENAAVDADRAGGIHQRCREALDLPAKGYPKEALIGLIGRLLHRWPQLQTPREKPVVYGVPRG